MANSAFNHEPAFTIPGSTTDNAVIRWDGTSGGGQLNSGILIDDSNVVTGITSLQIDNINLNGNTISSTAGTDLLITPLSGQQIVLDGTIIIDAGVVTAATSITSTEFVGGGVGLTALNGTQITSGTVAAARLGSGSPGSGNFLRGDGSWQTAGANQTPWTGNIDAGNYTLSNVGAAANNWTAAAFLHMGTGVSSIGSSGTGTTAAEEVLNIDAKTSNDMGNGFGGVIVWRNTDSGATNSTIGWIGLRRSDGADTYGEFFVTTRTGPGFNEALRLSSGGELSVDASAGGSAAQVSIFDDYDDPIELQRYAYSSNSISIEQREANRERMVELGIFERKNSGSGYFMNMQSLTRLLAGGIYQNRFRIDDQYEELKAEIKELKAEIDALQS